MAKENNISVIYEHKQKGSLSRIFFFAITCLVIVPFFAAKGNLIFALFALLYALFFGWLSGFSSSLTVMVNNKFIRIRFGLCTFFRTFPLDQIREYNHVHNPWGFGHGVHRIGEIWFYDISGRDAVELTFTNSQRVRIGTDEPKKLYIAIKQALQNLRNRGDSTNDI